MTDKIDLIIEQNRDVWKTRSSFFSFVKGIIRRGWSRHPVKLKLIHKMRKQIPNPNPKGKKSTVWGVTCAICHKDHILSNIEVDHITEETASLTSIEDIQSCVEKLLCVVEADLRCVCVNCHAVVSLSQKLGCSFEEAKVRKDVIVFSKLSITEMKNKLTEMGLCETIATLKQTKKAFVELYEKHVKEQSKCL